MIGRYPQSGVAVYEKQGKSVSRSAHNKTKPNHCTLLSVKQYLGEVDGVAALITNLKKSDIRQGMDLNLYTAEQKIERDCPRVYFEVRKVTKDEMIETDNGLALVGEDFANINKGWALVLVKGKRCSTQGIVTRCTLYQQYTTQEAMISAAKSHSNRKMKIE